MKPLEIKIGMIGAGTVGSGVLEILAENESFFRQNLGIDFRVVAVSARSDKTLSGIPETVGLKTTDPMVLCSSPEIDVILELAGGYDLPRQWVQAALRAGKHVVTANKAMLAQYGPELFPQAAESKKGLWFEAAVGGGIPIIKSLQESFVANEIEGLACIINGTCNYILTEMAQKGLAFSEVLQEAQAKGYAEADPSFDINGTDSAHKVALIASLCYGKFVDFKRLQCQGIESITPLDLQMADELGYVIKLLGTVSSQHEGIQSAVYPALLPKGHQLAAVNDVLNAVYLKTSNVGPILLTGAGAGKRPTASAVVSDLVSLARQLQTGNPIPYPMGFLSRQNAAEMIPMGHLETEFYLRLTTTDEPGVLAQVTAILAKEGISIGSMLQKPEHHPERVPVILITHRCREQQIVQAVETMNQLPVVLEPVQVLRFYQ